MLPLVIDMQNAQEQILPGSKLNRVCVEEEALNYHLFLPVLLVHA